MAKRAKKPNLATGLPAADLVDGAMISGRVGKEAVLLARVGDEIFAISATCTHYGGPLGEGVVAGDTVRCPWHHACFSLRTGEALRAPAIDPVAHWRVETSGDRVFVRARIPKASPTAVSRSRRADTGGRFVIAGADRPNVFTLRSLADSRAIIRSTDTAKRAVIIGASFIGLEVAASLAQRGLTVHVIAPEARPLERVLGPELGGVVQAEHEAHG